MHGVHGQRQRNERRLLQKIVVLITVFIGMTLPYIIVTIIDPRMKRLDDRLHTLMFYLAMSSYTVKTILFSLLNQQIKSAFIEIVNRILKRKNPRQEGRTTETEHSTCSNL
jgi:L-lactate permease